MSDLHLALLGAAVVLLLLLFGWSKWQEHRQVRRLNEKLGRSDRDPLLEPAVRTAAQRIEPQLGELTTSKSASSEPTASAPAGEAHLRPQLPDWAEDPLLDCVLELRCAHAADGVQVIDATAPLLRLDCGLPVHVVAWDARSEQWVAPDRFGFYSELLASIQLATRQRVLGDIEASKFIAAVQQVAVTLDADFDPPEVPRLRQRAAQLHETVARFDVQIGLTLEPGEGAWNPVQVQKAAQAIGLESDGPQRWQRREDSGAALFSLRLSPERRLQLELDVPVASPAAKPLQAMFAAAGELAALLNARVVDDHGRAIAPGSIEAIEKPLQALYEQMRAADIEAGSPRARRLFA
jgi:hypothetical protein